MQAIKSTLFSNRDINNVSYDFATKCLKGSKGNQDYYYYNSCWLCLPKGTAANVVLESFKSFVFRADKTTKSIRFGDFILILTQKKKDKFNVILANMTTAKIIGEHKFNSIKEAFAAFKA